MFSSTKFIIVHNSAVLTSKPKSPWLAAKWSSRATIGQSQLCEEGFGPNVKLAKIVIWKPVSTLNSWTIILSAKPNKLCLPLFPFPSQLFESDASDATHRFRPRGRDTESPFAPLLEVVQSPW